MSSRRMPDLAAWLSFTCHLGMLCRRPGAGDLRWWEKQHMSSARAEIECPFAGPPGWIEAHNFSENGSMAESLIERC